MNDPTIFVILGATGNLMKKKIIPALFALYQKQALPNHQGQLEHASDYTKLARSLGRMDGAHSKTGGCCCTGYRSVAAGSAGIKRN